MGKLYNLYKENSNKVIISTLAYFISDHIQPLWDANRRYVCKKISRGSISHHMIEKKNMSDIKIAYICDEMTYRSFSEFTKAVYLTPWNWYKILEQEKPDIFFCESAWSGIRKFEGCWRGRIYKNCNVKYNNRKVLFNILDYCKQNQIKTVFWNKEDPTYFGNKQYDFIDTALKFEYVYTTCEECVEEYERLGHGKVGTLPFGFSPRLYNPMDSSKKEDVAIFAGSWYPDQVQRCKDMELLFEQVMGNDIQLEIYDRNYDNKKTVNHFPEKYQQYISGYVPFEEMGKKIKHAKYAININSVKNSKTMFARRVFEMMAANVCIISNESVGMREMFGDRVWFAGENFDMENIDEICRRNVQDVLEHHTNEVRLQKLLTELGMLREAEIIRIGIVTNNVRETVYDRNLLINSYFAFEDVPRSENFFIIERLDHFDAKKIRQMLAHYQYLNQEIGICFAKDRYRVIESDDVWDTLIPGKNMELVMQKRKILKYGI